MDALAFFQDISKVSPDIGQMVGVIEEWRIKPKRRSG